MRIFQFLVVAFCLLVSAPGETQARGPRFLAARHRGRRASQRFAHPAPALKVSPADEVAKWQSAEILPKSRDARLQLPGRVVTTAGELSWPISVRRVQGPWLWIHSSTADGWFHKRDVVRFDAAESYFSAELARDNTAWAYGMRCIARRARGEYAGALDDINSAIALEPENTRLIIGRAAVRFERQEFDLAMQDAQAAIAREPTADSYIAASTIYMACHDHAGAMGAANEALRLDPKRCEAYEVRGMIKAEMGSVEGGLEDLDRAIALGGQARAYGNRAMLWGRSGRPDRAIEDLDRAVALAPSPTIYRQRARTLEILGRHEQAIADVTAAIKEDPETAADYLLRGRLSFKAGDRESGVADFQTAARLDPSAAGHVECARAWLDVNDIDRATEECEAALAIDLQCASAYVARGIANFEQKIYTLALRDYTQALTLDSENSEAFQGRAQVYAVLQDDVSCLADLNEVIRLSPADRHAYRARGMRYFCLGDNERAVADLDFALRLEPGNAYRHADRGLLAWALNDEQRLQVALAEIERLHAPREGNVLALSQLGTEYDKVPSWLRRTVALYFMREWRAASQAAGEAIEEHPDDFYALLYSGLADTTAQKYPRAIRELSEVLQKDPHQLQAREARAYCEKEEKQFDAAITDYNEIMRQHGEDWESLSSRGYLQFYQHNYEEAVADYSQALASAKDAPAASQAVLYRGRAACHAALSNDQEAAEDRAAAERLQPRRTKGKTPSSNLPAEIAPSIYPTTQVVAPMQGIYPSTDGAISGKREDDSAAGEQDVKVYAPTKIEDALRGPGLFK
ncbi:MAG TPA: tetratricopeptide repeat protein [Pirellulales bacterium]|jgi:tetratricopeptide (TPR) repeat protein